MAVTTKYYKSYAGRVITPNPALDSYASLYHSIPTSSGSNDFIGVDGGSYVLTGWVAKTSDYPDSDFAQTKSGYFADLTMINNKAAWIMTNQVEQVSTATAQQLINAIIKNNLHIYRNLCVLQRFSGKLTTAQRSALDELSANLKNRDAQLQYNDGLLTNVSTGNVEGYSALVNIVGSVTAVVIVSAVVVAALSTAAWYYYKAALAESERDVKYSDELTKILTAKLSEAEYQQLLKETSGIVTKQRILANIGGGLTGAKWVLIALLAVFAIPMLKDNYRKIKK